MNISKLDDIASAFRAACERWPHAPNLRQHYQDLARTWEEEGSSIIELTKSFLECVCWTVLNELDAPKPDTSTPTTTELLSHVIDAIGLRNQRGVGPLGKVISGHNKLAEGLNEFRNLDGSVAHGKDGFIDGITNHHTRVYLLSADAVINLILNAYDGKNPNLRTTREHPDRFRHLNQRIDEGCVLDAKVDIEEGVLVVSIQAESLVPEEAIELRITPSELLYQLDRQAYLAVLNALGGMEITEEKEKTETAGGEEFKETTVVEENDPVELPKPVKKKLLADYQGIFGDKVHLLYEFIVHHLLDGRDDQSEKIRRFVNTLLAEMEDLAVVDWARREPILAAMRVTLKKLIRVANIDGLSDKQIEPLINWLSREITNGNDNE